MKLESYSCDREQLVILPGVVSQPLVSVIVPVYKVEDFLVRCLDSLCRQSLRDIEIILVEDASPDCCGEICEEYAAKDERIKVFHHLETRGLSAARNTGITHASADYLMFVDSDDYVHEDFCKLPYEYAVQYHADLVVFRYLRIEKNGSTKLEKNDRRLGLVRSPVLRQLKCFEAIEMMPQGVRDAAWNKLYRKKLFNTVSYPEGYFFEDTGTTYKTILMAKNIYFLNKVLYFYCYHEGSITTLKSEKVSRDWVAMCIQQYHDLAAVGYPMDKLEDFHYIALTYCIWNKGDVDDVNYVFCRNILQTVKKIPEEFSWKRKTLLVLLKYCPALFDLVCVLWGKRWG